MSLLAELASMKLRQGSIGKNRTLTFTSIDIHMHHYSGKLEHYEISSLEQKASV